VSVSVAVHGDDARVILHVALVVEDGARDVMQVERELLVQIDSAAQPSSWSAPEIVMIM
jgi:hypothetical protein